MSAAARSLSSFLLFAFALPTSVLAQSAQNSKPSAPARPSAKTAIPRAPAAPQAAQFPVTRVSLYKNGVGFFEHAGHVSGDQSVTIDFTSAQLNDVLQSLTAIDLNGGRISGAGYNSTTPLEQQLKTLSLGLSDEATFSDFFTAVRGSRVEVRGSGLPFTGRLLNIETHQTHSSKDDTAITEAYVLTVISDAGEVRIFPLTPTLSVRLVDAPLHDDVNRYLELLDSNRNQGMRHVTLHDAGTGARELHVSYISEVPIWKSTYRILFTDAGASATQQATLQGWSVVDNTTGEDWNNVQLSLIAGAPQSFIQPLSTPYYSRRPEIPLPQEAQLAPQTHESGDEKTPAPPPAPAIAGMYGMGSGSGGGLGSGTGSNAGGGVRHVANGIYVDGFMGGQLPPNNNASATIIDGKDLDTLAASSIVPSATASSFDDFFEYKLTQQVTIRKNESALVPILQTKVDAERVTLWSLAHPVPLRALWITNSSNLMLDRGSFSIVENGNFAGEGLLDPIHPNERRLLSYAVDQAVRVSTESQHVTTRDTSISASKGVLIIHHNQIEEITYVVHNAATDPRTVVIEHPVHRGFTLDSDPKPFETTPTVYRYRVQTAPGDTVRLHVGARTTNSTTYRLTNANDSQLTIITNASRNNPALMQAIQPILDGRRHVADLDAQIKEKQTAIKTVVDDQARIRENLSALKSTEEQRALAKRYTDELNAQEDKLATLHKEVDDLNQQRTAAQQDLSNKIESLQINQDL